MKKTILVAMMLVAACSSDDGPSKPTQEQCTQLRMDGASRTYEFTFTPRKDECGVGTQSGVSIPGFITNDTECTVMMQDTPDVCKNSIQFVCPTDDDGSTVDATGSLQIVETDGTLEGVFDVYFYDAQGEIICSDIFDYRGEAL